MNGQSKEGIVLRLAIVTYLIGTMMFLNGDSEAQDAYTKEVLPSVMAVQGDNDGGLEISEGKYETLPN
ncbi:hypothetical protein Amet_0276 [Alkaliphilus metalliredigens QYMF]|uniref:Uncharacterized protein n=1 Tax=Alkaliphilus metalliredigens (strain QYMF) TaxID=293826 RepID=A6TJZ1_ALKMQ|nr:hypothetical protein [Alkaliphilus metalliredigens]ABR46509.1 hypothetical protein Amet_0276 [Alkaliphilus metalliredigens QYMF]